MLLVASLFFGSASLVIWNLFENNILGEQGMSVLNVNVGHLSCDARNFLNNNDCLTLSYEGHVSAFKCTG